MDYKKFFVFVLPLISSHVCAQFPQLKDEASIDSVIAAMTLEEKAAMVTGAGRNSSATIDGAAGATFPIPRLNIPQLNFADGVAGVRVGGPVTGGKIRYSTAFPAPIAMAATWDPAIVQKLGATLGNEASTLGFDMILGPAINIQRSPLNGRNFEYYTEDPVLNARIANAFIVGVQSQGVGAVVKHFVASNQETRRFTINQLIAPRALQEIYLPGFHYVVTHAKPWGVMSAYPMINGTPVTESLFLLQEILRDQWKFDGLVMSDWDAISNPVAALKAGNDLNMPGAPYYTSNHFIKKGQRPAEVILSALRHGEITTRQIDERIKNVLKAVLKTHAFTRPGVTPSNITPQQADKHAQLARQIATEATVLLKNSDAALPLPAATRIALFKPGDKNFYLTGGGSAEVHIDPQRQVGLEAGLRAANFQLTEHAANDPDALTLIAKQNDVALIVLSRTVSEGADRFTMAMLPEELKAIRDVAAAFHRVNKKLILLLNIGAPVEIADWQAQVDAMLLVWLPGQEAGNAIADILSGKANPSGKLPQTFPKKLADTAAYGNFPGTVSGVNYGEGIYVGYRYHDSKQIEPAYPFGFGLSYTTFTYQACAVATARQFDIDKQQNIDACVQVTNRGKRAGKEVVQLYVRDEASRLDRPFQELKAFQKVDLAAGESKEVHFTLDKSAFSYFDNDLSHWIVESGKFHLAIGSSSRDIKLITPLKVVSAKPNFTLDTPWIVIQTYPQAAALVAQQIGENETIEWLQRGDTFNSKLQRSLKKNPRYVDDAEQRKQVIQRLLDDINAL